ncbi:hypothetical protein Godav_013116 [Gossypium davidsonii]|uniref:FBT8 n=1 Tax=Gossypium davidsonii TaxID=34287 RepID=A0A7J8RG52_GOSDV|nr:hypothetical protein [Gossypium davidsonii]
MIYPVISTKNPIFLTGSKIPRNQERCSKLSSFQSRSIFRSFHHQNPGIKPKTQFLNPVIGTNLGEVSVRKGKKKKESLWQQGFQEMLGLCGLGYWVQGFRCFPWLALNFHMAYNLNLNPSTLQLVQNSGNLPMVAKPLFGILSDALYIGGAHRIPYICIGGQALPALMACVLLSNTGAAVTEVAKDALITEYGQKHRITGLQSYAFMALAAGGILGNLLGGYFLVKLPPRMMFLVFSVLLSIQLLVSLSASEECLGLARSLGPVPTGQSILYASSLLLDLALVREINLSIGIPNEVFALCFSGLAETLAQFKILPFSVLLATLCPRGCEGSLTSFLASALCLSSIFSGFWGVGLAAMLGIRSNDYSNLPVGILIQFLAALLPLGWIHHVPMSQPVEKKRKKGMSKRNRKTRRIGRVVVGSVFAYRRERESDAQK